jgi:hypothetical protein
MTVDQIFSLEKRCGDVLVAILNGVRLSTFYHEDNLAKFEELAAEIGIESQVLAQFAYLLAYIKELSESCEPVPSIQNLAQQFGLRVESREFERFERYILEKSMDFSFSPPLGDSSADFVAVSNESEASEAALLGMSVAEYRQHLEDLQNDAAVNGD